MHLRGECVSPPHRFRLQPVGVNLMFWGAAPTGLPSPPPKKENHVPPSPQSLHSATHTHTPLQPPSHFSFSAAMHPWVLLAVLCAGLPPTLGSGLDEESATVFWGAGGSFGHSVAQVDGKMLMVGAPLELGELGETGRVYQCWLENRSCEDIPVTAPPGLTSMSLGLSLVAHGSQVLACGPMAQRVCEANKELRGLCFLLPTGNPLPASLPGCSVKAFDIVFLMDGSGSIGQEDFKRMKTFITQVMSRFESTDTHFALMQFSTDSTLHFNFADFARLSPEKRKMEVNNIEQSRGTTCTATAIQKVVRELFTLEKGAREGANRILIVVTDGQKYGDKLEYEQVIPEAARAGIIRYAIGVGRAFRDPAAKEELHTIASEPSKEHVFQVDNFDALQGIQKQLQEKIFAIEGTQSAHSSSFQLEMAQEGFSALLTPEGPVLGAVGAYDWSGGVFVYGESKEATFVNVSRASGDMNDAYLGYAAESLSLQGHRALALGAPRYRHIGRLLLFHLRGTRAAWELLADATGTQVGSYFGASLCALDADGDGSAEVLLVGAPMFYGAVSGGHVAVCPLPPQGPPQERRLRCQQTLQGQPGHPLGRFGASLGRLGDIDGDGWPDVAVGAPLEDEERGAVYVFRGKKGGIASQYSQRIPGARFSSGPRYFGQAISGGQDLTGDRLPDVAVGAQGQVLLLRSQPLLKVHLKVAFQPQQIPTAAFDCQEEEALKGEVAKATICFLSTKKTPDSFGSQLSTTLRYQAALDPGRAMVRAVFAGSGAVHNGTLQLGVGHKCQTLAIAFTGCPQDTLTPLVLRLTCDATGDPIQVAGGLRPALSEDSEMVAVGTLPFEKDCGDDNVCIDDLQISFNFSGLDTIVVGVTDTVDITLNLRNHGENSYGTTVQLQHAAALSYRKAVVLQSSRRSMSLRCNSEPAQGLWRKTLCLVSHPIFHPGAEVVFTVTLDVPHGAELGPVLEVVANATSDNGAPGGRGQVAKIPVKVGVFIVLTSAPDSTKYVNVSRHPEAPPSAPVTHHYEVKILGQRGLPINVTFLVPTALGGTPLWDKVGVTPQQELVQCRVVAEHPGVPNVPPDLRELDCPVATCQELQCQVPELEPPRALGFSLGGSLALGWMATTHQPKVVLKSLGRVLYDGGRYHNSAGGAQLQVQTEVERLEPPNPLPFILGGSVGGLLLLALLALGLKKMGFFKRRYKEMMEGDETPTAPLGDPQE